MAPCCSKYVLKEVHRPTSKSTSLNWGIISQVVILNSLSNMNLNNLFSLKNVITIQLSISDSPM